MTEELVVAKSFGHAWEAHFAQAALEEAGIESFLTGENVFITAPFAAEPAGVKLQVRRDDLDEAARVLDDLPPWASGVNQADSTDADQEH